jgi:conjugative relaxase-like TrwC/TraI family protein
LHRLLRRHSKATIKLWIAIDYIPRALAPSTPTFLVTHYHQWCRLSSMLSIGKLAAGSEGYYLASVARGAEDYYLHAGESPGRWLGAGARELGLEGEVAGDDLRAVLGGVDPNGTVLAKRKVPGWDLTFSAPKSVSILHALGGPGVDRDVRDAHEAAVDAALDYLARTATYGRRGHAGAVEVQAPGLVAAAFRHRTSRAGDPQLHTHVLVSNMALGADGRWGALVSPRVYAHARTAGFLYQAHLRHELTRRLGVEWTPVRSGVAEIEGIAPEAIREFSQRREEIRELMAERGERGGAAAQVAALQTRREKAYGVDAATVAGQWRDRAADLGVDEVALSEVLGRVQHRALIPAEAERLGRRLVGAEGLTGGASSFTRRDLIREWCGQLRLGGEVGGVEHLADQVLRSEAVVPLAVGVGVEGTVRRADGRVMRADPTERRYSTPEMLRIEQQLIETAQRRLDAGVGVARAEALDAAIAAGPTLGPEQAQMVRALTTSGRGVEVVVGRAGTGKTYALDTARQAWEASGHRVIGCATAARAAEELRVQAGIDSYTIAGLLRDLADEGGLPRGIVVVVDEAGMVGTRALAQLGRVVDRARGKLVLVGDPRQLPEIDAGGAFRGLATRLGALELTDNRRQRHGWERAALDEIRHGSVPAALEAYQQHGRVVVGTSADAVRGRLVQDWWDGRGEGGEAVMVALRQVDVDDLNARARYVRHLAGELPGPEIEAASRVFAIGDRVVALENARRLGVLNGQRGTVTHLDLNSHGVRIALDSGREVELPAGYLDAGRLAHAYAITGHKAQGMTADRCYVLGDEAVYREWGYVALSRGREQNAFYIVAADDAEARDVGQIRLDPADPVERVRRALERSGAKDMALESGPAATWDLDLRELPEDEVRRERDALAAVIGQGPPDPTAQIDRLRQGWVPIEHAIGEARQELSEVRARLGGGGVRRPERGALERVALDVEMRIRELEGRLTEMAPRVREVGEEHRVWREWASEAESQLRRYLAAEAELAERGREAARWAQVLDSGDVVDLVGSRPDGYEARSRWRRAVEAVCRHTLRWGADARGAVPEGQVRDLEIARERQARRVERALAEATRQRDLDRSVDRGIDPSL